MDLNTYNQVTALPSNRLRGMLAAIYIALLIAAVGCAAVFAIAGAASSYTLAAALAVPLLLLLLSLNRRRVKRCQFCSNPLNYITRPMLLTQKHLATEGTKQGDYFYTRCYWGLIPLRKRWAKISNRALACHHCRLTEHHSSEHYQPPTATELAAIEST